MTVTPKKEKKEEEDSKKDVKDGKETKSETEEKEVKKDPLILTLEDIREHCQLLERSVVRTESRYTTHINLNTWLKCMTVKKTIGSIIISKNV